MEILIGLITGLLIGLTGTGGGVMLTPLLMLLTPLPTVTIIGTGLLTGAATKLVGAVEHRRLGQVHMKLALWLRRYNCILTTPTPDSVSIVRYPVNLFFPPFFRNLK